MAGGLGHRRRAAGGERAGGAAVAAPVHDHAVGRVDEGFDRSASEQDPGLVAGAVDLEHAVTVRRQWTAGKVQSDVVYPYHFARGPRRAGPVPTPRAAGAGGGRAADRDPLRAARAGHVAAVEPSPGGRPRGHPRRDRGRLRPAGGRGVPRVAARIGHRGQRHRARRGAAARRPRAARPPVAIDFRPGAPRPRPVPADRVAARHPCGAADDAARRPQLRGPARAAGPAAGAGRLPGARARRERRPGPRRGVRRVRPRLQPRRPRAPRPRPRRGRRGGPRLRRTPRGAGVDRCPPPGDRGRRRRHRGRPARPIRTPAPWSSPPPTRTPPVRCCRPPAAPRSSRGRDGSTAT